MNASSADPATSLQRSTAAMREFPVILMPRPLRAAIFALAMTSLCAIVVLAVLQFSPWWPELTPPRLVRALLYFAALPALAAFALRRALAASLRRTDAGWSLQRRWRPEVALAAGQVRATPWRWPFPATGLRIALNGRAMSVQSDRAATLLAALGAAPLEPVPGRLWAYAAAKQVAACRAHRWWLKFGLFPIVPVFVAFRLHQRIMYGGLLGQYQMYGLGPYLSTLVFHWVLVSAYLVLYAGAWRAAGEAVALAATAARPLRADAIRRRVEAAIAVAYYAGVPLWMAWRFFLA